MIAYRSSSADRSLTQVGRECVQDDSARLVAEDRRVFAFELHYGKGDLKNQVNTAFLGNWSDITEVWAWSTARAEIEDALRLLDSET